MRIKNQIWNLVFFLGLYEWYVWWYDGEVFKGYIPWFDYLLTWMPINYNGIEHYLLENFERKTHIKTRCGVSVTILLDF